jgi:ketosteroid isomerase-like protein
MTATQAMTDEARAIARRFIEAFNARDEEALRELVAENAEFRRPRGEALRGAEGVQALLAAARDADVRLVPLRGESIEEQDGTVRLTMRVRELIGPDDIERIAEWEVRDGRVTAFSVRPLR